MMCSTPYVMTPAEYRRLERCRTLIRSRHPYATWNGSHSKWREITERKAQKLFRSK